MGRFYKIRRMNDDADFDQPRERISKRATGPSRSQRRREALDVLDLALQLMDAPAGVLPQLALDEDLAALLDESRRIHQHVARKRQSQFLAKHLRRLDDETLAGMRAVVERSREHNRRDAARQRRAEGWRQRLLDGGDDALTRLLEQYPQADSTRLRQLVRQAQRERDAATPPHAFRELLRLVRDLDAPNTSESADDTLDTDETP